jgi:hypothetical protein
MMKIIKIAFTVAVLMCCKYGFSGKVAKIEGVGEMVVSCGQISGIAATPGDSVTTKIGTLGKYKTVATGVADYKGRYNHHFYQLFRGEDVIVNSEMFNEKQDQLLKIINQVIEKEYLALKEDPENAQCFEGTGAFSPFQMNMLGIEFDKGFVKFHCTFGLSSACLSVDGATVTMKREDLEKYIKE